MFCVYWEESNIRWSRGWKKCHARKLVRNDISQLIIMRLLVENLFGQKFNDGYIVLYICISISGPALWNALPVPIRNAKTILTFRKLLKSHLFALAFPP